MLGKPYQLNRSTQHKRQTGPSEEIHIYEKSLALIGSVGSGLSEGNMRQENMNLHGVAPPRS